MVNDSLLDAEQAALVTTGRDAPNPALPMEDELAPGAADRRSPTLAQGPSTLPGKGPNPAPDQPEPDMPADEEPLQEDEPEDDDPARPGRT